MAFTIFSILYSIFSLLMILGLSSKGKKMSGDGYIIALTSAIAIVWGTVAIFIPSIMHAFLWYVCGLTSSAIILILVPPIGFGNLLLRMGILTYAAILLASF